MYLYVYVYVSMHMFACVRVCVRACVRVCVRVHVLVQASYIDDDCFYYNSWRNNVIIAFGTLSSFTVYVAV